MIVYVVSYEEWDDPDAHSMLRAFADESDATEFAGVENGVVNYLTLQEKS